MLHATTIEDRSKGADSDDSEEEHAKEKNTPTYYTKWVNR
jgi:hypothetical protein